MLQNLTNDTAIPAYDKTTARDNTRPHARLLWGRRPCGGGGAGGGDGGVRITSDHQHVLRIGMRKQREVTNHLYPRHRDRTADNRQTSPPQYIPPYSGRPY